MYILVLHSMRLRYLWVTRPSYYLGRHRSTSKAQTSLLKSTHKHLCLSGDTLCPIEEAIFCVPTWETWDKIWRCPGSISINVMAVKIGSPRMEMVITRCHNVPVRPLHFLAHTKLSPPGCVADSVKQWHPERKSMCEALTVAERGGGTGLLLVLPYTTNRPSFSFHNI